jgi:hypothetical protein
MMSTDSETVINHTDQRHQRSINKWKPYYIALAVWLVAQIAFYMWMSNYFS